MQQKLFSMVVLIGLSVLVAAPVQAAPFPGDPLGAASREEVPAGPELASDVLFLELPATEPEPRLVEITYSVDGLDVFAEEQQLAAMKAGEQADLPRAVELLAWHPNVRARLLRLSATDTPVTVSISRGGREIVTLTLDELRKRTRMLQETGFVPVKTHPAIVGDDQLSVRSELVEPLGGLPSVRATQDPACVDQCWAEYDMCEASCEANWDESCFSRCNWYMNQCLEDCPEVCTGPTIREYEETDIIGAVYLGTTRCLRFIFWNYLYDRMGLSYKSTRYRETTQCDGTTTTAVVRVTYWQSACWRNSYQACDSPVGDSIYYLTCP